MLFASDIEGAPDRGSAIALARAEGYRRPSAIYASVYVGAFALVLVSIIGSVPGLLLLCWLVPMGLCLAYLLWQQLQWHGRPFSIASAHRLLARGWIATGLQGLAWGASCLFIMPLNWEQEVILHVVATSLCAVASASLAASPRAARAFMLGISVPYVACYMTMLSVPYLLLAIMMILMVLAMLLTTRIAYGALIEGIHAQFSARAVGHVLDKAEQQWRELSETAEAFALYDNMHRLQLWNDGYAHLLGLEPQALQRFMNWARVWQLANHRRLPEAAVLSVDETLAPRLWTEEIQLGAKSFRSTVRRLPNGNVAVSHVDITALKQREAELLDLQAKLEEARDHAEMASNAKSRFLANMSHELRTPLNAVIGFSDLMLHQMRKAGDAANSTHASYAQTIHDSGYHLLTIVEDMLDLARIEAGKMKFIEAETDLIGLLRASADLAVGRNVQQRSRIVLDLPDSALLMRIDPQLTRQALINLIGNALKFTRGPTAAQRGRVFVSLQVADNRDVHIAVRDEGIGIPTHLIEEVLKPFAQVEGSETRRFGGVGLGLPLAKQFIELQQGSLTLESEQGRGTTARLTLPGWRVIVAPESGNRLPAAFRSVAA